jgi:DNA repair exonuclease SbcCD ATPase subunit
LNLTSDDDGELGDKVQQVRAELESLKQKQEEIEREKARLEELKRRQDSLEQGRSDMLDKLTRALVVVQRETEESQKRVEQMHSIYASFSQHLRQLEDINARSWSPQDLPRELSKALSSVEDARAEYIKSQAKLSVDTSSEITPSSMMEGDYSVEEERSFVYWLRSGFAFTLPLQIIAVISLLVYIWSATTVK